MSEIQTEIVSDNTDTTINSQQVETLKKHFPQCFDKEGQFIPSKLNEIVSNSGTSFSKESYGLDWLGKSYARLLANEPPLTLLAEDKEHNAKPENKNSENLLIKGDNLEVLKHLKGAYSESIKMIYIDPPYNTGSDGFVYQDDRKFTAEQLSELAGISSEEAQRILEFTNSNANSHSAWLTFMYPRLYIARELLKDDGVIFISIDDNEFPQLKLLCDDVFGAENFAGVIKRRAARKTAFLSSLMTDMCDYIVIYVKSEWAEPLRDGQVTDKTRPVLNQGNNNSVRILRAGSEARCGDGTYEKGVYKARSVSFELLEDLKISSGKVMNDVKISGPWRINQEVLDQTLYITRNLGLRRHVLPKELKKAKLLNDLHDNPNFYNEAGTEELHQLFDLKEVFNNPKPSSLIKFLIKAVGDTNEEIIFDFFAGSGTTAHAIMQLNAADGGHRKFIMAQLPEPTKSDSAAHKAGHKTIFDITKARIERVAEKIRSEHPDYDADLGFKIVETLPIFDGYLDALELSEGQNMDIFDGTKLNDEQLQHLLTTWKIYDGCPLTQELETIELGAYTAFRHNKTLYLMHSGFTTESLRSFLIKLDATEGGDKDFDIEKVVLFGYNFDSKHQLEINEAVRQYRNKKQKTISVVVRY